MPSSLCLLLFWWSEFLILLVAASAAGDSWEGRWELINTSGALIPGYNPTYNVSFHPHMGKNPISLARQLKFRGDKELAWFKCCSQTVWLQSLLFLPHSEEAWEWLWAGGPSPVLAFTAGRAALWLSWALAFLPLLASYSIKKVIII